MKDSFLNFLSNTTLRPPYNVYKDLAIQNNIRNIQKTDEMDDWINKMRSQFTYMKIPRNIRLVDSINIGYIIEKKKEKHIINMIKKLFCLKITNNICLFLLHDIQSVKKAWQKIYDYMRLEIDYMPEHRVASYIVGCRLYEGDIFKIYKKEINI